MAGRKIVVFNRKASHEYFLEERFEAAVYTERCVDMWVCGIAA